MRIWRPARKKCNHANNRDIIDSKKITELPQLLDNRPKTIPIKSKAEAEAKAKAKAKAKKIRLLIAELIISKHKATF